MKYAVLFLISAIFCNQNSSGKGATQGPYLYGTSLNTKGVANGDGVGASETTAHSLDDVSQSKAYANGDNEVNARTQGQTIWTNILQGANTSGDAVQNGKGNSLADSWSKAFTPTKEYYLANYYKYISFLNSLYNQPGASQQQKDAAASELQRAIANYENPDYNFNGELSFDLQQARASGNNTSASTNSKTFNWGRNDTIQKGSASGAANNGWSSSNNSNWNLTKTNYLTTNKNAAAFGNNAASNAASDLYIKNQQAYNGGDAWGQAEGKDAVGYSTINANQFGYGALQGDTNTYIGNGRTTSVSDLRSIHLAPQQVQGTADAGSVNANQNASSNLMLQPGSAF